MKSELCVSSTASSQSSSTRRSTTQGSPSLSLVRKLSTASSSSQQRIRLKKDLRKTKEGSIIREAPSLRIWSQSPVMVVYVLCLRIARHSLASHVPAKHLSPHRWALLASHPTNIVNTRRRLSILLIWGWIRAIYKLSMTQLELCQTLMSPNRTRRSKCLTWSIECKCSRLQARASIRTYFRERRIPSSTCSLLRHLRGKKKIASKQKMLMIWLVSWGPTWMLAL